MLPTDDCDDCVPDYLSSRPSSPSASLLLATLPFVLTFVAVAVIVERRLFPFLSGGPQSSHSRQQQSGQQQLPTHNFGFVPARDGAGKSRLARLIGRPKFSAVSLARLTFSANIGLSAVLVELLLCEISNALDPAARRLALRVTLPTLLVLLVLVAPALEMHSVLSAAGLAFHGSGKFRLRIAIFTEVIAIAAWLLGFWYVGRGLLGWYLRDEEYAGRHTFVEGCLERVGVIGISLMACLSGFAAVSAPWQLFATRTRQVTEADVARKQAGLDATEDMLLAKRSRLRAIERRMSETVPDKSILGRVMGTFRGSSESQERSMLYMEISGLETMRMSLNNTLYTLRSRLAAQHRSHTVLGRLVNSFAYSFALYCIYRLLTTSVSVARRTLFPGHTFASGTDPVTHIVGLLSAHWNPTLNQAAWTRQISFLLSGFMLLAAFNSALQTFLLLARAFPSLLNAFHTNLALVVSQVTAAYVISSALLLRSNLPHDVGSVVSEALGAPLEPRRVDAWFEGWFVFAAGLTAAGVWVGRKFKGGDFDDEVEFGNGRGGDLELGKRN